MISNKLYEQIVGFLGEVKDFKPSLLPKSPKFYHQYSYSFFKVFSNLSQYILIYDEETEYGVTYTILFTNGVLDKEAEFDSLEELIEFVKILDLPFVLEDLLNYVTAKS